MRHIVKSAVPPEFEDWKNAENPASWDALQNEPKNPEPGIVYYSKRNLREFLLAEQGYLCCYCQRQIENTEHTTIEHLYPRNGADKLQGAAKMFDYQNLMAACDGGESESKALAKSGMEPYPLWCDKSKKEHIILLSPLQSDIESRFKYELTGTDEVDILPVDDLDEEAEETLGRLNLNTPFLEKRRGESIAGLIFKDSEANELISPPDAAVLLAYYESLSVAAPIGRLSEYHAVKIHFLRLISKV